MRAHIKSKLSPDVLEILEDFQRFPGKKIGVLANQLGLKIIEEETVYDQDGYLDLRPECQTPSGYVVVINEKMSVERKRWTAAHEIAHYLLHDVDHDLGPKYRSSNGLYFPDERREEVEANQFAADLLAPMSAIHHAITCKRFEPESLHKVFWISQEAMKRRLREYGKWKGRKNASHPSSLQYLRGDLGL